MGFVNFYAKTLKAVDINKNKKGNNKDIQQFIYLFICLFVNYNVNRQYTKNNLQYNKFVLA